MKLVTFLNEIAQYSLQQKYQEFNQKLFDGELPEIPITWAKLKRVGGRVAYSVKLDPTMGRLGKHYKYRNAELAPDTMKMEISTLYQRSIEELDKILVHEMIHVYFAHTGDFSENHGMKFERMRRELSQKAGFEIPLTDSTEGLELTSNTVKPIGVIIYSKKDGTYGVALMSEQNIHAMKDAILERWKYFASSPNYGITHVYVYTVASPVWTKISAQLPIQRKQPKDLQYYKLKDHSAFDDLKDNGTLLGEI